MNQTESNQIESNQIKSNWMVSNQISNRIKSNQIESNRIKSNRIKSNRIKQIESNRIKSNQIKSNRIKPNQIKFRYICYLNLVSNSRLRWNVLTVNSNSLQCTNGSEIFGYVKSHHYNDACSCQFHWMLFLGWKKKVPRYLTSSR